MHRCYIPFVVRSLALLLALFVSACGGGGGYGGTTSPTPITPPGTPGTYTVSGTVTGMVGTGLVLTNNGGNDLLVNANGGFTFSSALYGGFPYSVAVKTQPSSPAQTCTVTNGSGTVSGNVTNVQVVCKSTIGGTVSGLVGTLVLQNNGGDNKSVSANGSFTFATAVATGSGYAVTVLSSTPAQQCTVTNGSGTANGNVTNVQVVCRNTIGGTIGGLVGTVVLRNNGGDDLSASANGGFTFATALDTGSSYAVTVFAQPTGQTCLVTGGGTGSAFGNVTNVQVSCVNGQWTWMGGSAPANQLGVYGTKGTAAPANIPGGRYGSISWTDSANGDLWLFGGFGYDSVPPTISLGDLNDLWKYNITSGQWTWVSGANTQNQIGVYGTKGTADINNVPGARESAVSWIDAGGNLWFFGGFGRDSIGVYGELNDLWKFSTGQWTWMSGSDKDDNLSVAPVYGIKGTAAASNVPGGRRNAVSWTDASGNLWLFGGYSWDSTNNIGPLNDLWKFNIASGQWTWVSGSNVGKQSGTYGVQGTANAANVPGARESAMGWFETAGGNLWLFGGSGYDSSVGTNTTNGLNDLWKFNIASGQWTWVSGSNVGGQVGTYGTLGVASASNVPGSRNQSTGQIDAGGNLWLFGGSGGLGDLWKFNIASGQWTWMNGSKFSGQLGTYGTLGAPGTSIPGAQQAGVSWIDSGGNQWFFGNYYGGHLNDLWRFK